MCRAPGADCGGGRNATDTRALLRLHVLYPVGLCLGTAFFGTCWFAGHCPWQTSSGRGAQRAPRAGARGSRLPTMEQMKSGKAKNIDDGIWQDREIRFDTKLDQLEMRSGELGIDSINSVEDTKGNNGEKGSLSITNLRLIWICHRNSRINLSIGYNAVVSINIRTANSRLRGNTQALYVMTKFNNSRFEFVFTNLVRQSPRLFTTVQAVYRAYDTSRLYRDLKLRGAIIR